jgi:internalin A
VDLDKHSLTAWSRALGSIEDAARAGGERVSLAGLGLGQLPGQLWQLRGLRWLDLAGNGLESLPAEIGDLVHLQSLDLAGNYLSALPDAIGDLGELRYLNLASNRLECLPSSIGRLARLKSLYLNVNRLRALPDALGHLDELELLHLGGNDHLTDPPPEIVVNGTYAVFAYLRGRLDPNAAEQWASKLIIVGEAAVGKTSLTRMLVRLQRPAGTAAAAASQGVHRMPQVVHRRSRQGPDRGLRHGHSR